jgi:hypothetical protein
MFAMPSWFTQAPCDGGRRAWLRVVVLLGLQFVGLQGPPAIGQDSAGDPRGVVVAGVADTFDELREAIAAVRQASGRQYRVVVIGDGQGRSAAELLDSIVERWQREAAAGSATGIGGGFDPSRDVTILVDEGNRSIAMKVPSALEKAAGLDQRTIEGELISGVFGPKARDGAVAEGLEDLIAATEFQVRSREQRRLAKVEAERVFRTRTLPLLLVGTTAALGLAALTTQWLRHRRLLRTAREKLAAFKSEVVSLSDLLDSQQERHRMLPHADPDFSTPMAGQTRGVYDGVQESIARYRERWLGLMDVWERADARIKDEWWLGTAASEDVIGLLDSADARPPLADVAGACRSPLDQLESAHETSRELVTQLEALAKASGDRVTGLSARGRSGAAFQPGLAAAARVLEVSRHDVESDPVMARGRLEGAIAELEQQSRRLDAFEAADDRRKGVVTAVAAAEARVRGRRAEGWLLTEPGADPTALLTRAREQEQVAAGLLDAGEVEAAVGHLDAADRAVAEALAMLERVAAARARFDELLPAVVARLEGVKGERPAAVEALEWLDTRAATASWDDIADNVAKADEGVSRGRALVAEAREAADPSRQHLFRAVALLEEAARQIEWAAGCQAAVLERREGIASLIDVLPGRIHEAGGRVAALATRLERQRTDRPRANEHCREAGRLVATAARAVEVDRPDYPRTAQVVEAAELTMARGVELADEDERLARQAVAELEEVDGLLRRVAAWYAEGLSADLGAARRSVAAAQAALQGQRYEDSIAASAEAARLAREAHAAATAEAQRRRQRRQMELQRRQMEESFVRMSRGSGPWVIQLPGGPLAGPNPWGPVHPGASSGRSAGTSGGGATGAGRWSSGTAEGHW